MNLKEYIEQRIYVAGLDSTEFFNLMKQWFKWEKLPSVSPDDEDIIRGELSDYAHELDDSRRELESFIDGLVTGVQLSTKSVQVASAFVPLALLIGQLLIALAIVLVNL